MNTRQTAQAKTKSKTPSYLDHKLLPGLNSGVYGNIDYFSASGVSGWVLDYSAPDQPIVVEARLNGTVVGVGRTGADRHDVASIAKVDGKFGYQLVWHWGRLAKAIKTYGDEECPPIDIITHVDPRPIQSPARPAAGEIRKWLKAQGFYALSLEPFSAVWLRAVANLPVPKAGANGTGVKGFLEAAMYCGAAEKTIVVGWFVGPAETILWLEDGKGTMYPLDKSYQFYRQDVYDSVARPMGGHVTAHGFIATIETSVNHGSLKLRALTEDGVHSIGEVVSGELSSDPPAAARWLFAISSPVSEFSRRARDIDVRILDVLLKAHTDGYRELPVRTAELGVSPDSPQVSLIIPLYGRTDFVEHQLIEFSRDIWFRKNAEIVFVIDDPVLAEGFISHAHALYRLYQTPFRWVWGGANRGFSGANNLGASCARGEYLLFMNSDVIPQYDGWLQPLVDLLASDAKIGAVAPRLVFADGSIQHAGMAFRRREEIGVWINHHPNMGLDPSLDPVREAAIVQAVTGACLLMRRSTFDSVDGWDNGYLIGDFEDSDLCLKLRAAGFKVVYCPSVQLTHLERQSFKLLGNDDFRQRVVLYNATRHQTRWGELIEATAAQFR